MAIFVKVFSLFASCSGIDSHNFECVCIRKRNKAIFTGTDRGSMESLEKVDSCRMPYDGTARLHSEISRYLVTGILDLKC